MKIIAEIDLTAKQHRQIQKLRNSSFPEHKVDRSYYKQLPHYRVLEYDTSRLIGYMGLDYRVIGVGESCYKILGVIDLCVDKKQRGKGTGTSMLAQLSDFAAKKDVDFIILISDHAEYYLKNGFERIKAHSSWLRLHEHKNFGVAFDHIDDLFVKSVQGKKWPPGHVDWLGYMF